MARSTLGKYLKPTPLVSSKRLSEKLGWEAYVKLENLQPTNAFKVRGGVYFMSKMYDKAAKRGVVTASTGNDAQSIACAGMLFGIKVKIVMPFGVPQMKTDATRDLGAEVIKHGRFFDE